MNSIESRFNDRPDGHATLAVLNARFGAFLVSSSINFGDAEVCVDAKNLIELMSGVRLDPELQLNLFVNVTAVDYLDLRPNRFEVVYHLLSLSHLHRLRVKVQLPEDNPVLPSLTHLWSGAIFMEREVFDMYGIKFEGHPDLRRILMYDEFEGHPLRKDYPVQLKQPRVQLRAPEVHNTARDMRRSPLIQINKKKSIGIR